MRIKVICDIRLLQNHIDHRIYPEDSQKTARNEPACHIQHPFLRQILLNLPLLDPHTLQNRQLPAPAVNALHHTVDKIQNAHSQQDRTQNKASQL